MNRAAFLFIFLLPVTPALNAFQTSSIKIDGSQIDISLPDGLSADSARLLTAWIHAAARAVDAYYGRFPVPHVTVHVDASDGNGIGSAVTNADAEGGLITVSVGRATEPDEFRNDWKMTHEMTHLAFPSMPRSQHWIEEGLATYVEPWARVRIGTLAPAKVWGDLKRDMPQGVPSGRDRGLDNTRTWASTYWGGALFCLLADVEIRKQTGNEKGLEDALRAIVDVGGVINTEWNLADAFKVGDQATKTHVLENLYDKMKDAPAPVDLDALWQQLGVKGRGKSVTLDNAAPLAGVRRAIERRSKP